MNGVRGQCMILQPPFEDVPLQRNRSPLISEKGRLYRIIRLIALGMTFRNVTHDGEMFTIDEGTVGRLGAVHLSAGNLRFWLVGEQEKRNKIETDGTHASGSLDTDG